MPWLGFTIETFILQVLTVFILFLIYSTSSLFYTLFYLLLEIVMFGVFLSFYQLELFTAFLWLAESVIIFVSLLLLFYTTVYDNTNNEKNDLFLGKNSIIFLFLFFFIVNMIFVSETEFYIPIELNLQNLWDDFYEALSNDKMNDLYGLFLSFYLFNSFEFLMVGLLLLIGSIICVNLNRFLKTVKTQKYPNLFNIFDVFKNSIKMLFMRKQNLVNQEKQPSSTRIFKKK